MEQINKPGIKVVLFHSDTCGHCKEMLPEWKKFAEHNLQDAVNIEQQQIGEHPIQHQIEGFPTIVKMLNGQIIKPFIGDRTAERFTEFLNEIPVNKSRKKRRVTKKKKTKHKTNKKTNKKIKKKRKSTNI